MVRTVRGGPKFSKRKPHVTGGVAAPPTVDVTAPVILSSATVSIAENSALGHLLTANETVSWSIVGGADQLKFEIAGGNILRFVGNITKDYEAPDDADVNNTYVVQVRATDLALNTTNQTITVTVTDVVEVGFVASLDYSDARNSQYIGQLT